VETAGVRIRDCVFQSNSSQKGGAIHVNGVTGLVDAADCIFIDNRATDTGGAGSAESGGRLTITRSVFVGNSAGHTAGALACANGILEAFESLFAGNSSGVAAGAMYFSQTFGSVKNCTFYQNTSPSSATLVVDQSPSTNVTRNIFSSDTGGFGVQYLSNPGAHSCNVYWDNNAGAIDPPLLSPDELVADPLFCDAAGHGFTLHALSPAARAFSPCGMLIGAFPVECGSLPARRRTWGEIKTIYEK
jgi:predicted outer membrane repeat protein